MERELEKRVQRGLFVLDRARPGWTVDLETFDLRSGQRCVLGQVFGLYQVGRDQLYVEIFGSPVDEQKARVFAQDCGFVGCCIEDWDILRTIWRRKLTERFSV